MHILSDYSLTYDPVGCYHVPATVAVAEGELTI